MKHEGMKMDGGSMKHEGMKMDGGSMKHEGMKMDHGSMKMESFNGLIEELSKSEKIVTAANVAPDPEGNRKKPTSSVKPSDEEEKGTKMDHGSMRHMHHEGMKMNHGSMKHEGMKMNHGDTEEKPTEHNDHGGRK
jgi:hypothetical protein